MSNTSDFEAFLEANRHPDDPWREHADDLTIFDLLSYRLYRTANMMQKSAATTYRAMFDVSLAEWRTLALLASASPITQNRLAAMAGLDKGQMSRVVSALVDRGLLKREDHPDGGRATEVILTRKGNALYQKIIRMAAERHAAFLACLTEDEKRALDSALTKITRLGRAMAQAAPRGGG